MRCQAARADAMPVLFPSTYKLREDRSGILARLLGPDAAVVFKFSSRVKSGRRRRLPHASYLRQHQQVNSRPRLMNTTNISRL